MEVKTGKGESRGRWVGQRQKVVGGRACGGEVKKRETGVDWGRERGGGYVHGVCVSATGSCGCVMRSEIGSPLADRDMAAVVDSVAGSGVLFRRFRAGASLIEESRFSSSEAFLFLEDGCSTGDILCGSVIVGGSPSLFAVSFLGAIASPFTTAGRNPGVPA